MGKSEVKETLRRTRRRSEDDVKVVVIELEFDGVD